MSDHPLSAELRGDRVVIEIGIDNLVSAFLRGPEGQRICQKDTGEYDNSRCVVTDDTLFAREFVRALNAEEEDGSTAVTRLFAKSFEALMDDGPMSVWWWELGIPCPGGFRASDDDRSIIRVPAPTKKPKAKKETR